MSDSLHEQVRAQLYPKNYEPYSLQELMQREPKFQAVDIEGLRQKYNSTVPKDRQFNRAAAADNLARLQEIFDTTLAETNARDIKKYFAPNSALGPSNEYGPSTKGHVNINEPKNAYINSMGLLYNTSKDLIDTALHELAHSDHRTNDVTKADIFGEVAPFNYRRHIDSIATPKNKEKYFPSGNAFDSEGEIRANLRASLGRQPYGTSAAQHFGPLLDAIMANDQPAKYIPKEMTRGTGVNLTSRDAILKAIEMDLFPRERWLEPRQPTYKERIKDTFDSLLNRFR